MSNPLLYSLLACKSFIFQTVQTNITIYLIKYYYK